MDFWGEGSENEFVAYARNKEYERISFFEDSSLFWGQIWWLAGNLSEKARNYKTYKAKSSHQHHVLNGLVFICMRSKYPFLFLFSYGKYISSIYIKYQLDIKSRAPDSHHEKIQLYLREEFLEYDEQQEVEKN